jgi:xanthine dehydrogenase accessory factor
MSPQLAVLEDLLGWLGSGHRAALLTVCATWPSSPCERGVLCAIRDDGRLSGSVSGGLVEDDLIDLVRSGIYWNGPPRLLCYTGGGAPDERRLPAGAQLTIALEPSPGVREMSQAVEALRARRVVAREMDLESGAVRIEPLEASSAGAVIADGRMVRTLLRPAWRVWPLASEAVVQAIRRVARFVHFDVVVVTSVVRSAAAAAAAPPATLNTQAGNISANELDPLTVVLALDDALLPPEALLDDLTRRGAPLCVRSHEPLTHGAALAGAGTGTLRRIAPGARTPEEIAVAAIAALIELRAARLAGQPAAVAPTLPDRPAVAETVVPGN